MVEPRTLELEQDKNYCLFDIEANGLENPDKIWCIVCKNLHTGDKEKFYPVKSQSCDECLGRGHVDYFAGGEEEEDFEMEERVCPSCNGNAVSYPEAHKEFQKRFKSYIKYFDYVVGHNIIGYDVPVVNELIGTNIKLSQCIDTLVLSRLFRPITPFGEDLNKLQKSGIDNRLGGHGLEAWGKRLGNYKIEFNDFNNFSKEMLEYCEQDVDLNEKIFYQLMEESRGFSSYSIRLEHKAADLLKKQEQNGFKLDMAEAQKLYNDTYNLLDQMLDELQEIFPPKKKFSKKWEPSFKKDGEMSKRSQDLLTRWEHTKNKDGSYNLYTWQTFNPRSPDQLVDRLMGLGWEPKVYTDKGNPKTDAKTLDEAVESLRHKHEEVSYLADFRVIANRYDKVKTWLELAQKDGRVHGKVNPIGAGTHRCAHFNDNMANIASVPHEELSKEEFLNRFDRQELPSQQYEQVNGHIFGGYDDKKDEVDLIPLGRKGHFGWESRKCWTVEEGNVLLGCDAAGIQLRALAHYMNDPDYTEKLLNDDIHKIHQKAAGIATRHGAKTFIYSWLMGAGDEKIGKVVGIHENEFEEMFQYGASRKAPYGKNILEYQINRLRYQNRTADRETVATILKGMKLKEQFMEGIPALKRFKKKDIPEAAKRGYIVGLDGRKLWIPSEHLAMSLYLQGFEAVIMKLAMSIYQSLAIKKGIEFWQVAFVHDEFQIETRPDQAEELGELVAWSIWKAGDLLNVNCPMGGDYHIGKHWGEVH